MSMAKGKYGRSLGVETDIKEAHCVELDPPRLQFDFRSQGGPL